MIPRETADDRYDPIALLHRLEIAEVVFTGEIVGRLAGEVRLEKQLPEGRIVWLRRPVERIEAQPQTRANERVVEPPDGPQIGVAQRETKVGNPRRDHLAKRRDARLL